MRHWVPSVPFALRYSKTSPFRGAAGGAIVVELWCAKFIDSGAAGRHAPRKQ